MDWATAARRWEPSIPDLVGIVGLGAVIGLMSELGTRRIEERVLDYADQVSGALEERGWSVVSSRRPGERSGILSLSRDGVDVGRLEAELRRRDVACAVREGRPRVSVHFYNDASDLDRLLACLPR